MAQTQSTSSTPPETIELVLGGGGIKGFGHLGLLKAIEERNVAVGKITGVSIGSAVAAFYANGYTPDEIERIFLAEVQALDPRQGIRGLRARGLLRRGGLDLKRLFEDVCIRYKLKPKRNLRILAYNVVSREPVVFEGTRYDLPTAVAASCSVPGVMRPVWFGQQDNGSTLRTILESWRGQTDEGVLVDGGVHHPHPGEFCKGRAIIAKLGVASEMPKEWLSPVDMFFHAVEVLASRTIEWYFPDPQGHIIIRVGKPDVATLTFGLSPEQCRKMIDHGHRAASKELDRNIKAGLVPTK